MKSLLRNTLALALLTAIASAGCQDASTGGSQTNWVRCSTSADCKNGQGCVAGRCQSNDAEVGQNSATVRTSCVDRLDAYWGQCLDFESECHDTTATLRVVRKAICKDSGQAVLSCTDPDGQHVQVVGDVPAFGGTLPSLSVCACEPKTRTARDADLQVATENVLQQQVLGCRTDGVSAANLSGISGQFDFLDGGPPGHDYGGQEGTDAAVCRFGYGSAIGGCMSFNACVVGCKESSDCPDPGSGTPRLECDPLAAFAGSFGSTCRLHCDVDHVCPDGMLCVHGGTEGDICLWPRHEGGSGCP